MFNRKKIEALEERIERIKKDISCLKGNHSPGEIKFHSRQYFGGGLSQIGNSVCLSGGQWTKEYSTITCTSCGVLLKKFTLEEKLAEGEKQEKQQ